MIAVLGGIGYRLVSLTISHHQEYAQAATQQYQNPSALLAGRGDIFFSDSRTGATTLAATNHKDGATITRVYPLGQTAAHALGFVGYRGYLRSGQYGVEASYDETLAGLLPSQRPANQGEDIVLTIDPNVQAYVEKTLDDLLDRYLSTLGTIIVEDPKTGAIIAMASSPSYNPNSYQDYPVQRYLNPAVQAVFEPGSSFKPFTMAAAVDAGVVTADTTYTDPGEVKFGNYTIMNYDKKSHGLQTMTEVLEHSLNTGVIFAQQRTGLDAFLNYVVAFGFGQKAGVDLSGEVPGSLANLYEGRPINFATAAFGQGISVTPIQLVNGISAIANNGKLMRPYIVKEIIHADGSSTPTKPQIIGSPIKDTTAHTLAQMLTAVVDKGFDRARIAGYDVAGKTGTAQIPDANGSYLENNEFIHDFVGFAPSYSPKFVILIKIDKPKGINFASNSLSPVFGDITQFLLRYYNIPPTRT